MPHTKKGRKYVTFFKKWTVSSRKNTANYLQSKFYFSKLWKWINIQVPLERCSWHVVNDGNQTTLDLCSQYTINLCPDFIPFSIVRLMIFFMRGKKKKRSNPNSGGWSNLDSWTSSEWNKLSKYLSLVCDGLTKDKIHKEYFQLLCGLDLSLPYRLQIWLILPSLQD